MHTARRQCCCLVFALATAALTPAQHRAAAAVDDQQLLRDLGPDETCVAAERALVRRGAAGVALLTKALADPEFGADPARLAHAIYTLGKLGDAATPAVDLLLQQLPASDDGVLRNTCWALGEIGAKAEAEGRNVLARLQRLKPQPGWGHQEWAFACRRIELGNYLSTEQLARLLRDNSHASVVAAADVICRLPGGSAQVPQQELLAAWRRFHEMWRSDGQSAARAALELARALVHHGSDAMDLDEARAALVEHFDVEVRLAAVMQLGQGLDQAPRGVVEALRRALADGSVLVRREAVTSLGMLGKAAADAVPVLTAMLQDADAQIRGRAAAALHAIAGKAK